MLGNFIANAQRHTSEGPLELRAEQRGSACRIGVLDRGPGIPENQVKTVFRPFHRVDASRSPATGSTGLGLAIVRQLAQANGWQVWLENRREGGLAAWVDVPSRPTTLDRQQYESVSQDMRLISQIRHADAIGWQHLGNDAGLDIEVSADGRKIEVADQ